MSFIAKPVFSGAPVEKLAPVDVYGDVDTTVRNAFTGDYSAFGQTLSSVIGTTSSTLKSVGSQLKDRHMSPENAVDLAMSALTGSKSKLNGLKSDVKRTIIDEISGRNELAGALITLATDTQKVEFADVTGYVEGLDYESAEGIMSILGDVADNPVFDVVDIGVDIALMRGVLEEVTRWGVPGLVDQVLETMEDDRVRRQVIARSARNIVNSADIDSIEAMLNSVGPSGLTSLHPDFPRQVLNRYRLKPGVTPAQYPLLLTQLVRVMDQLKPDWLYVQRGDERIWNLSIINIASADAQLVFMSDAQYRTPFMIASKYPQRSTHVILKAMYPYIAIAS